MNIARLALAASLAAALVAPIAGTAQTAPTAPNAAPAGHMRAMQRAMAGITLTAAQRSQIAGLVARFHAAHPKGSPHDPQAAKQLHQSILNVLTTAQQAQFKANLAALRKSEPAEANEPTERGGAMRGMGMMRGIDLTDAQKAQIAQLRAQFVAAHPRGSEPDPSARKALMTSIMNVLTPAQQAQLNANRAAMPSPEPAETNGAPRPRGAMRGMGMLRGIDLTAAQQAQIAQLRAQYEAAHPRGGQPDPAARKALMTSIMNVLTPAQQAQVQANRAEMQRQRDGGPFAPSPTASPTP